MARIAKEKEKLNQLKNEKDAAKSTYSKEMALIVSKKEGFDAFFTERQTSATQKCKKMKWDDRTAHVCFIQGCEYVGKTLTALKLHSARVHKKAVHSKQSLDKESSDKESSDKESRVDRDSLRCSICSKVFTTKSNLNAHIKTHNKTCKECGESFFGTKEEFNEHVKTHFVCTHCSKQFDPLRASRFRDHIRSHTGERSFPCGKIDKKTGDICTYKGTSKENLRLHERIHTGEKPYECQYCLKTFSRSSNLKTHERIHTGEKPFTCTLCPKSFSQSSALKVHQEYHEREGKFPCPNPNCTDKFSTQKH